MGLDASLILQGRSPNILGAMAQGLQIREAREQMARGNALQQLYAQHGAGALRGDPNALAALAAVDPARAMDLQSGYLGQQATRQNMDVQSQRLDMDRETMEMRRAEIARTTTAEQRAQAFEQGQFIANAGSIAWQQGPEEFARFAAENGIDADYEAWPSEAAQLGADLDMLGEMVAPQGAAPADEYGRYVQEERAAGRKPLSRIEYAAAIRGKPPSRVIYGPDGNPILVEGEAATVRPLTERQGLSSSFLLRMEEANEILDQLDTAGMSRWNRAMDSGWVPFGSAMQSDEYKQFEQAKRDFINANLRQESGAVIGEDEFASADQQYFPQPNDPPEVIEQKRQNRRNAIAGVRISAGPGAGEVDRVRGGPPSAYMTSPVIAQQAERLGVTVEDLWAAMDEEGRAAWAN